MRPSGLIAISLEEDDQLGWVNLTSGKDELIFVTRDGSALRYSETEIRVMGRTAKGVIGIRMRPGMPWQIWKWLSQTAIYWS